MPFPTTSPNTLQQRGIPFTFVTFLSRSLLILAMPFCTSSCVVITYLYIDYVITIRESGLSVESLFINGIVTLLAAIGLAFALQNLTMTTLQQLYGKYKKKLKTSNVPATGGKKAKLSNFIEEQHKESVQEKQLYAAAYNYSLFVISLIYFTAFLLLGTGLLAGLTTFLYH